MQVKGPCGSKYCTNNDQMKFNVLQKKINYGKMQAVVKLIIANCNLDLPEEKSGRLCQKQDG